jgi:CheY-like chemotaxis protein
VSVRQNYKILLIDDNPGDAILLREALKIVSDSVAFEAFQSGKDALDKLFSIENDKSYALPDLIILDLNMPGLSGLDVVQALKSSKCLKPIPVVMMTTSSLSSDVKDCLTACANSVIVKPMDFDDYVKIIDMLVKYWFHTVKRVVYE